MLKGTHIYDWLEEGSSSEEEKKVKEYLDFRTREAVYQMQNKDLIKGLSVFCVYENKKYKITGGSRMGDIWLAKNHERESGYDKRVMIDDCSSFTYIDNRKVEDANAN